MASGTALLVASAGYRDPKLRRLRAPAWDAQALGRVLADPAIGEFDVELALDEPESVLRRKIARFFADRRRDELLLLHMSCHGLKDDDGNLYFATVDTEFDHLDSTAVSAEFVHRQMARSRSGRIVLLLDCCYSGAFSQGMAPRAGAGVELKERFAERGRAVISASNAMEYSFEGDALSGEGKPAIFTAAVVKALETGKADRDGDGWISVDELYDYVYEEIRDKSPQRPVRWLDLEGDLRIAKSVYLPPVQPTELPADLRAATESPLRAARLGAVQELSELLAESDQGLAQAAHDALKALAGDDSQRVATAAKTALQARREAEAQARHETEAQARREAEAQARYETEAQARRESEEQARRESEEQARREAEEQARRESEKQALEAKLSERRERRAAREAEEQKRPLQPPAPHESKAVGAQSPGLGSPAARHSGRAASGQRDSAPSVPHPAQPAARLRSWRSPWVQGGVLAALAALVAAVALFILSSHSGPVRPTTTRVGKAPQGVAVGEGSVWVANYSDGTVSRIDAKTGKPTGAPIRVGNAPFGVAVGDRSVWVANHGDGSVWRLDANTGKPIEAHEGGGRGPQGVAVGEGSVWVTNDLDGTVSRIDANTGKPIGAPIRVGYSPGGVAVGEGSVWVTNFPDTVSRLDAKTGTPIGVPIRVGKDPVGVAVGEGSVWVTNYKDNTVSRLDAKTGKLTGAPIGVGTDPRGVAVGEGSVWVTNGGDNTVSRLNP